MSKLIFHSAQRAAQDWRCPRSRYYTYDFEKGIKKDNLSVDLYLGSVVHDAIAGIAASHQRGDSKIDIQKIVNLSKESFETVLSEHMGESDNELIQIKELTTLVGGLLYGFYNLVWPNILTEYPNIKAIEQEMIFPHDLTGKANPNGPFIYMAKPDLVMEDTDGNLCYFEWKTTGTKKSEWIESWKTAKQIHCTMKAIEFTFGQAPQCAIVQGLYKGSQNYGKFSSPLVYGYKTAKANPPFTLMNYSYEYRAGFKKFPTWELDSLEDWVNKMPQEMVSEQFPQTPRIFLDESLADSFFRQRAIREADVLDAVGKLQEYTGSGDQTFLLDKHFPQNFDQCRPAWGQECEFKRLCHNLQAGEDPLNHGYLQKDRSHESPYIELAGRLP